MKKLIILLTALFMFSVMLAGCSSSNTEDDKASLITSLDDFYKSYHSLNIRKNGGSSTYDAAKPLVYIFGDLLSKVREVDMDSQEQEKLTKGFDYAYYDYRLKFEGAADILFTLKGNVFHFEREKQLYVLWGDSKPLWDNLVFDSRNKTVDIHKEKIQVMVKTYTEDINGDGIYENINLSYERGGSEDLKGDLILSIDGSKAVALKDEEWFTKPYHLIGDMPEIKFQQEQNGKSKAVLLTYSWATNGIGSTGVINAYKYAEGSIREVKAKDAERIINYMGENNVNVIFPDINRTVNVKIDADEFKRFLGEKDSFKQQLEAKETFHSHPFRYIVKDYNGDGQLDLCNISVLRCPPLALCRLYTYYQYENGEFKPVQAFAVSLYNEDEKKKYLSECIFDTIEFNGYLTMGDKGIMDANFKPAYDYTPDEIKKTLQEFQDEKILKLKDGRLYINY